MRIEKTKSELFRLRDFDGKNLPLFIINRGQAKYIFWKDIPALRKNFHLTFSKGTKERLQLIYETRYKSGIRPQGITLLYNPHLYAFTYQTMGMEYLLRKRSAVLADEVGMGKTIIFSAAAIYLLIHNLVRNVLIITRTSIKYQIRDEIYRFFVPKSLPEKQILILEGTPKQRQEQWLSDAPIKIASYEQLRNDYDYLHSLHRKGKWSSDVWILDEASKIKNRTTSTAKRIKALSRTAIYRWAVTATPIENGLTDLLSIAEFVQPGLFPSKKYFDRRYCRYITIKTKQGKRFRILHKTKPYKHLDKAKKRLKGYYLRRTLKEAGVTFPPIMATITSLEATKIQRKLYRYIKREYPVLKAIVHAQGICDSPYLLSKKFPKKSPKTQEILELIRGELSTQQIIIVTKYVRYLKLLSEVIKEPHGLIHGSVKAIKRELVRKQFQSGDIRILIMTDAGEYGLNLQAGSVLINADLPWNPARLKQRIGRICRLDSKHDNLRVINLVIRDTIEERIVKILKDKERIFEAIFEKDGIEKIGDPIRSLSERELKEML